MDKKEPEARCLQVGCLVHAWDLNDQNARVVGVTTARRLLGEARRLRPQAELAIVTRVPSASAIHVFGADGVVLHSDDPAHGRLVGRLHRLRADCTTSGLVLAAAQWVRFEP